MIFHPVLVSLPSVSDAVLASDQAHGAMDGDLLAAVPLAGAELVFLVLTAAGPVHEIQWLNPLVALLGKVTLQQLSQIGELVVRHCCPQPSESMLVPQALQNLMDWICPTFGMTDTEKTERARCWALVTLSFSTSFFSFSSIRDCQATHNGKK